ncbi:hypothetical protein WMY93_025861 [Mugilogobius chulae]|uniref:Reverse transcriptase n=1 Tax=Mugilogobius chulae TaxID=88201 RepID=A0AAW0N1K6_9GOBI
MGSQQRTDYHHSNVVPARKSNLRLNDQIIPKPTDINMGPTPKEHPYASHIPRYSMFPSYDFSDGSANVEQCKVHSSVPNSAPDVTLLSKTKGNAYRHELLKPPTRTKKAVTWAEERTGFLEYPKPLKGESQIFYPTPTKLMHPKPKYDLLSLSDGTSKILTNLEQTHWLTTYQIHFSGYEKGNLKMNYRQNTSGQVGEIYTLHLRETSPLWPLWLPRLQTTTEALIMGLLKQGKVGGGNGTIADIEDSYKYLEIPQANGNLEQATRKAATAKYLQRVRQVLRSQLNGKNKSRAVIRYPAGIIRWPKEEIQTTDVKTRKLLTMHGGFHPKSSTLRLYASRKEGGRGLVSVRATIQDETSEIHKYIKDKAPTDGVLSECLRQWGTDDEVLEEEPSWEDKPLHGMYHRNITEVADLKKSYQWLERAGLKDSTEALILAAQEQALSTRAIEAQIYHTRQDPRCRLCKEAPETIQHITAGCKMLAGKACMERHNQVAGIVYRNICAEYGLETPRSKWETPPKVVENDRAKILWVFQIQTDRMVMANQPDIVVVDKEQRRPVVVDVAIPSDGNIRRKEHEKLEKYQGLREELEKAWKVKATVVPVVIGALGAMNPKLDEWLQHIPGSTSDISVQKSAVLGTARILRRTLKLPGLW